MKTKLIALVALAMADFAFLAADVGADAEFEVDAADAEGLLTAGKAKLASPAIAATPTPQPKAAKKLKARVLTKCAWGEANDLVEVDADEAKAAEADGLIDTNKAAVAYAASLDQNKA
jgi:hypothetical protein